MNISLRNRSGKFRRLRHFTALLPLALGLGACAAVPTHEPVAPRAVTAQPLARAQLPIPDAQHDLLAQLLAGELALTRTDLATASGFYARAMLLSDDPKVAAQVAAYVNFISPVQGAKEAMEKIDPSLMDNPLIFPSESDLAKAHVFRSLSAEEETNFNGQFQTSIGA